MEQIVNATTSTGEMMLISRAEYESLLQEVEWYREVIASLNRKLFGRSSEKSSPETKEQTMLLFGDEPFYPQKDSPEPEHETITYTREKHKSGSVADVVPADIPVKTFEHHPAAEDRICPVCGEDMKVTGKKIKRTLVFIPARAYLREDIYYTYSCTNCSRNGISTPFVSAPHEPSLIKGGFASPEAVAYIMSQKFVMGSPLYRLEAEFKRQKIFLSRQTMTNWLLSCAENWLKPIWDALHKMLVRHDLLHADETVLRVLHEADSDNIQNRMWLYRTSGDAEHPIVLYDYQPDRTKQRAVDFLHGFKGYLQTDGYEVYQGVPDVCNVGCWAHVRRKFTDAEQVLMNDKKSHAPKGSVIATAIAYCNRLFDIEKKLKELSPEERFQQRLEQAKPVLDAFWAWQNSIVVSAKSKLGNAFTYLRNQWDTLTAYLKDGRIELSNNRAERSIKPFVMARKNFLFCNTSDGARSTAYICSLIESAKENLLDPYRYLVYVLREAPKLVSKENDDWMLPLLPQNAPDWCSTQPKGDYKCDEQISMLF